MNLGAYLTTTEVLTIGALCKVKGQADTSRDLQSVTTDAAGIAANHTSLTNKY